MNEFLIFYEKNDYFEVEKFKKRRK